MEITIASPYGDTFLVDGTKRIRCEPGLSWGVWRVMQGKDLVGHISEIGLYLARFTKYGISGYVSQNFRFNDVGWREVYPMISPPFHRDARYVPRTRPSFTAEKIQDGCEILIRPGSVWYRPSHD